MITNAYDICGYVYLHAYECLWWVWIGRLEISNWLRMLEGDGR